MLVIGLTGGIGSGKSTVAEMFAKYGAPLLDADKIARELTQKEQPAFLAITQHFKKNILLKDGSLDRKKLREIIFHDTKERHWLEHLLHPLISDVMEKQIKKFKKPYCIAVIPLLLEVKPLRFIDRILVIDTPEPLQIERTMKRDHLEKSFIVTMMKTQVSRATRLAKADDTIKNEGTIADLVPQVEKLHQFYLSMSS